MKPEMTEKMNKLKSIGKEIDFDFEISAQAQTIIENFDNFPAEHFKQWFKKRYCTIHGGHLHHYLEAADGIMETKK